MVLIAVLSSLADARVHLCARKRLRLRLQSEISILIYCVVKEFRLLLKCQTLQSDSRTGRVWHQQQDNENNNPGADTEKNVCLINRCEQCFI